MRPKSVAIAGTIGFATFVLVGIAVTALLEPRIEFSMFVGFPVGLLGGVLAGAAVLLFLADNEETTRVIAGTLTWFLVGFLGTVGVLMVGLNGGVASSVGVAVVVGVLAAALAYLRIGGGPIRKEPLKS